MLQLTLHPRILPGGRKPSCKEMLFPVPVLWKCSYTHLASAAEGLLLGGTVWMMGNAPNFCRREDTGRPLWPQCTFHTVPQHLPLSGWPFWPTPTIKELLQSAESINYGLTPLIMPPLQSLSLPHRQAWLCQHSPLPATVPGGPPVRHNHHLQLCKESYLWTGGISTPERAQKVTTDCQSTCGHLWHADAIFLQFFSGHRAQH